LIAAHRLVLEGRVPPRLRRRFAQTTKTLTGA
jgi:hypothetical protein